MNHQSDQQFEQKNETKREKSGSKNEKSLEFMLSQCCESSLTRSAPQALQGEEEGEEGGPGKISPKMSRGERAVTGENAGKGDGGTLESSVSCVNRIHAGLSFLPRENSFHSPIRPDPTRCEVSKHRHKSSNSNWW